MAASWSGREIVSWRKEGRPVPGAGLPTLFSAEQIDVWERNIVTGILDLADDAAIEALQEQTIAARQEVVTRESARSGGIAPLGTQVIDGVRDAPLSAIQPDSVIVLIWNYLPEVATRTYEALVQRSPRDTGRYIEGLLVFIDSEPGDPRAITNDTRQVQIVASVPYARRLEVGKDERGRPWVKQVAPHIVEETAIVAKRKFGDLANVTYMYADLSNAWALSQQGMIPRHFEGGTWRYGHTPRTRRGLLETHVRYPAILIVPRE
jgi:hypothetical protein